MLLQKLRRSACILARCATKRAPRRPENKALSNLDDFGSEDDDGNDDDDDYNSDGDYVEDALDDATAAVVFRGGGARRRGRRAAEGEDEGEDLLQNALGDYQPIAAVNTYDRKGINDRDYRGMDAE